VANNFQNVAIVCVHGINMSDPNYFEPLEQGVFEALPSSHWRHVTFRSVFWANVVRGRQKDYIKNALSCSAFRDTSLRRLVIQGLGDAAAYQKTKGIKDSAYYEIQSQISWTLDWLDSKAYPDRLLVLVGHSLGCHIISSYMWDMNKLKLMADERLANEHADVRDMAGMLRSAETTPFRKFDTLAGLVTLGANMPLFTFNFGPSNVYPITHRVNEEMQPAFPGRALGPRVRERARWLNFYSRNDPLGYPLKPLNPFYDAEARLPDIAVRSEGLARSMLLRGRLCALNALPAHSGYCRNAKVIKMTARLIQDLVESKEEPSTLPTGSASAAPEVAR
jgi:hypothetical protein